MPSQVSQWDWKLHKSHVARPIFEMQKMEQINIYNLSGWEEWSEEWKIVNRINVEKIGVSASFLLDLWRKLVGMWGINPQICRIEL